MLVEIATQFIKHYLYIKTKKDRHKLHGVYKNDITTTLWNLNYLVLFSVHSYEFDDTASDFLIYQ